MLPLGRPVIAFTCSLVSELGAAPRLWTPATSLERENIFSGEAGVPAQVQVGTPPRLPVQVRPSFNVVVNLRPHRHHYASLPSPPQPACPPPLASLPSTASLPAAFAITIIMLACPPPQLTSPPPQGSLPSFPSQPTFHPCGGQACWGEGKLAGGGGQAGWGCRAGWQGVEGRLAGGGQQAG